MSTPADELKAAAFQLRNPSHLPGLKVAIDPELAAPLADWLEHEAIRLADWPFWQGHPALAVARLINAQP